MPGSLRHVDGRPGPSPSGPSVDRRRRDLAAQPAQHLGHDRDVGDPGHVGDHAAARGEQRGRHQLERRVLRADHVTSPASRAPPRDPDHIHVAPSYGVAGPTPAGQRSSGRAGIVRSGIRRLCVMAVHLTRIYTKTGDAGTTSARQQRAGRRRPIRGSPRTPTSTSATPRSASRSPWAARRRAADGADDRPERPVRRRRRPVQPDRAATRSTRRCGSPRSTSTRLEGWCDEFNARLAKLDSFILPGGTAGRGAAARGPHGRPARRARGVGAGRRTTRTAPARCRQSTSTGSPTCCSSCPERRTRTATCNGCRAASADRRRPAPRRGLGSRPGRHHRAAGAGCSASWARRRTRTGRPAHRHRKTGRASGSRPTLVESESQPSPDGGDRTARRPDARRASRPGRPPGEPARRRDQA